MSFDEQRWHEWRLLPEAFYEAPADVVGRRLLGHLLLRRTEEGIVGGPIVEAEAYLCNDPACHAFKSRTPRNETMWGPHGRSYIYLIYGYHYCFNAVCRPSGYAEAVLIRAIEPSVGEDLMRRYRECPDRRMLTSGPAKLCQAMRLDRELDGAELFSSGSSLVIAENPDWRKFRGRSAPVVTTTRIGISQGAELPLRYYLEGSEHVSKRVKRAREANPHGSKTKFAK